MLITKGGDTVFPTDTKKSLKVSSVYQKVVGDKGETDMIYWMSRFPSAQF